MSDANITATGTDPAGAAGPKTKLFKTKKEIVVLAVSATVFAFVIWKMYLSKGKNEPAVAELDPAAAAVSAPAPAPAGAASASVAPRPASMKDLLALLDVSLEEERAANAPPATLGRDPFTMDKPMREQIYQVPADGSPPEATSRTILLTPSNFRQVLATIPGAEAAAKRGLTLNAVMTAGSWKGAAVNGKVIALGSTILGFKLVELDEQGVVLQRGKHRIRLPMRPPAPSDEDESEMPSPASPSGGGPKTAAPEKALKDLPKAPDKSGGNKNAP